MKTQIVVISIFCLLSFSVIAQTNNQLIDSFYGTINGAVHYPNDTSFCTILKIEVSKDGSIKNVSLSDSANPRYKAEFMARKKYLGWESISLYIRRNKIKQTALLLPLYITYQNGAAMPLTPSRQFMQFNKKDLVGKYIILKPGEFLTEEER